MTIHSGSLARSRARMAGLLAVVQFALVACSADGPRPIDPATLVVPVPRAEPKSRWGNPDSYVVFGQRYYVRDSASGYVAEGIASWYGSKFHGQRTSNGETYDMYALTAAHRTLPLPTYLQVTNLESGRETIVRVNDRGPFHGDRLIDLSYAAAVKLGFAKAGTARVRIRALTPGAPPRAENETTGEIGAAPTSPAIGDVFIQVGAFVHYTNAQEARARVHGANIGDVDVSKTRMADGRPLYRVRIGPVADAAERRRILDELEAAGIGPAYVLHGP